MKRNKLIITKDKDQIIDFEINGDIVDVDYFEYGNEIICAVVMKNMTIEDFMDLTKSDIPQRTNIDILVKPKKQHGKYIFERFIRGNGFEKQGDSYFQKFYFDDITGGDELYGKPAILLFSVFDKVIKAKKNVSLVSKMEIDDAARLSFKIEDNDFNTINEQYVNCLNKVNAYFEETIKLLDDVDEAIISRSFKIKIPIEIRMAVKQYLIFFEDFVFKSKGYKVSLEVKNTHDGLQVNIADSKNYNSEMLQEWLVEFVGLLYQNIDNLTIIFENNPSAIKADLLLAEMKNQISTLKNSLEIARIENKYLVADVNYLRELIDKFQNREFTISQNLIQNTYKYFIPTFLINNKPLTESEKQLLEIIYANTDSEIERQELINGLKAIKSPDIEKKEKNKYKSLFKKFVESGISEAAKQLVREIIGL